MYQYQEEVYLEWHKFYTWKYYIHSHNIQCTGYSLQDKNWKVLTYILNWVERVHEFPKEHVVSVKEKLIQQLNNDNNLI